MKRHRHVWRLGRVTPAKDRYAATVRYSCACGRRKWAWAKSPLVVETARLRAKE